VVDTSNLELNVYDGLKVWEPKSNDINNRHQIMKVSGSTKFLVSNISSQHSKLSLEIGTGVGYIAMQLAKHSDMVIATDINMEALKLAKFNAEQNGINNIQFICCDMFASFKEHKFDLIVSNPPFVISPDNDQTFRDNDFLGDGFMQWLINEIPNFLSYTGKSCIIGDIINHKNVDFDTKMEDWFDHNNCSNLVIQYLNTNIKKYIRRWISDIENIQEWEDYYTEHNVKSLVYCLITMQKSNITTVATLSNIRK